MELVPNRGPLKLLQSRDLDHVQYIKHSELASNTNTNVMFHTIFTLNRRMKVLLDMIFFFPMPINPSKSFKYDYIQYIWLQLKGFLKIILLKITTLRKRGKKKWGSTHSFTYALLRS